MSQTRTISNQSTHLSRDSLLMMLFAAFVYYAIATISNNSLHKFYYFGCAMGIIQCVLIHEGALYVIYIMENFTNVDFSRLFGHIQLAPYMPQVVSGSDDDDYSEGSEDEKEKDD